MISTDSATQAPDDEQPPGPLERALGVFGDVRAGEGATVLLMCLNVFLPRTAYHRRLSEAATAAVKAA